MTVPAASHMGEIWESQSDQSSRFYCKNRAPNQMKKRYALWWQKWRTSSTAAHLLTCHTRWAWVTYDLLSTTTTTRYRQWPTKQLSWESRDSDYFGTLLIFCLKITFGELFSNIMILSSSAVLFLKKNRKLKNAVKVLFPLNGMPQNNTERRSVGKVCRFIQLLLNFAEI